MLTPAQAVHRLRLELFRLGVTELTMYEGHLRGVSVLSVDAGLTVWCHHGFLRWCAQGRRVLHPVDDPGGAAYLIAHAWVHPSTRPDPRDGMPGSPAATARPADEHRQCPPDADGFCPLHGWDCADYRLQTRDTGELDQDPEDSGAG